MDDAILTTDNLSKSFGDVRAVRGVNFDICRGEIFSLLGPNGAGKTTTISMLSCLIEPTGGDAWVDGHSIRSEPQAVKEVIGVVPQEIALYQSLSARENLLFWGRMYGMGGKALQARIAEVLEIVGLADRAGDRIETFSGGMKRRINIAVGLLHRPKLVFMDEPTVGIDPQSRRNILDTVKELNAEGMTVLYTTHYMEEAQELSDRIGIIDHGELIALGTQIELAELVGQDEVLELQVGATDASEALLQALGQARGVREVSASDGTVRLLAADANAALAEVIAISNGHQAHISGVSVEEPNLEAVFLHLTGRALRD
ncbi:MAG TPA: ABC transporter ATP-binding protein [Candidatus Sulfomarinibacteraceae bacterium]|nr:ABC transporter ATP-binding protein [Candidatus Sulfomarinibacteraceae bacterium]